jgi:hypothetical protein
MAWTKYKEIKYALGGIPTANLTDFPKLVSIVADSDIASELSGGGGVKFTSADGSSDLAFGLYPTSALASGTVHARVKIGSLLTAASVGDVIARLYYSSGESTTQNKAGTVSNGYALFMPLEDDPSGSAPQMRNWVTDTLIGTSVGTMTSGDLVSGKVGSGIDFDGVDDAINCGTGFGSIPLSAFTAEFHAKASANTDSDAALSWDGTDDLVFYPFDNNGGAGAQGVRVFWRDVVTLNENGVDRADGNFHAFALVSYSTTDHRAFADGSQILSSVVSSAGAGPFGGQFQIGGWAGSGTQRIAGIIDEVRISSVARSADWLAYAYADDFTNSGTFTLSAEQGGGGPTVRPSAIYYRSYLQGAAA